VEHAGAGLKQKREKKQKAEKEDKILLESLKEKREEKNMQFFSLSFYKDRRGGALIKKIYLTFFFLAAGFTISLPPNNAAPIQKEAREKILYAISPSGIAEYEDLGIIYKNGKRYILITFTTHVLGFYDKEMVYIDPDTSLPARVERDVRMWGITEYLTEEYDQRNFVLSIKKFKNNKQVKEYTFKKNQPIHNAVYLPFYLRTITDLSIGWSFTARFPQELRLTGIEEIATPAGKFTAYHFTSTPKRFEIWITKDNPRVPVKIKDTSGLGYTLVMKKHSCNN
jgi:hypothetical protein